MQIESAEFITVYVEQIIEVAVRATLAVDTTPDVAQNPVQVAKELASALLEQLEQTVGSDVFIGAYSQVQRRIQSSKAEKRRAAAAEAIAEPHRHAVRKVRVILHFFLHSVHVSIIHNGTISDFHLHSLSLLID